MADLRVKDFPDAPAPADTDEIPLDGAAGVRSITWANLKQRVLEAIHAATNVIRGGVKLTATGEGADPKVYGQVAADALFVKRPVPMADLPEFGQYSGPSTNPASVVAGDWLRIVKWPQTTAAGGFTVQLTEVSGYGEYEVAASFSQGLGTLIVRNGSRGFNGAAGLGISAMRLVRKVVGGNTEVYLEIQAGSSAFGTGFIKVLMRALLDGSIAGNLKPVIEFSAAEIIGGAITVDCTLTLRVGANSVFDYIVWGVASPSSGGTQQAVYLTSDGRMHFNDARGVGIQASAGNGLDLFAAAKLWARGGTDGKTLGTPALPRLVRAVPTALAAETSRDVTHNLNLATGDYPVVQVYNTATGALVPHSAVLNPSANVTRVFFAAAQTGTYLFVIIG